MIVESDAELLNMKTFEVRFTDDDLPYVKLKALGVNKWILVTHDVPSDCSLKEFIGEQELIFKRGRAFYEFKNEIESII